jgi:hypothetical protein
MKININVKNATKSSGIGTLAWTARELSESDVRLCTSKTGHLVIASYRKDGTLATIIATESEDKILFDFAGKTYYEIDGDDVVETSKERSDFSITYCFAEERTFAEECADDSIFDRQCLFGHVLTPAAKRLTEKFIKKCVSFLALAVAERDTTESNELCALSVEIKAR